MSKLDKIRNKKQDYKKEIGTVDKAEPGKNQIFIDSELLLPEENINQITAYYFETDNNYQVKLDDTGKPVIKSLPDIEKRIKKTQTEISNKTAKFARDLYFIFTNKEYYRINNFKEYIETNYTFKRQYAYELINAVSLLIENKKSLELIENIEITKLTRTARIRNDDIRSRILTDLEQGKNYTKQEIINMCRPGTTLSPVNKPVLEITINDDLTYFSTKYISKEFLNLLEKHFTLDIEDRRTKDGELK